MRDRQTQGHQARLVVKEVHSLLSNPPPNENTAGRNGRKRETPTTLHSDRGQHPS